MERKKTRTRTGKKYDPVSLKNLTGMGQGRKKGVKNKFTSLKDSFLQAFEDMGGTAELQRWGKDPKNRTQFYGMVSKMLPNKLEADIEHSGTVRIIRLPKKGDGWDDDNNPNQK